MASRRPQIELRPGLNLWRLLRTDRDGAKQAKVIQSAAAAVRYFVGEGLSPEANATLIPVRDREYRFGDVRPLRVLDVSRKAGQSMPAGTLLADRMAVPGTVPTVRARRPWWVLCELWWRGPLRQIDYPGVRAGILWPSWTLDGADWVLDRAVYVPREAATDPGGSTWLESMGDQAQAAFLRATDDLGDLLGSVGGGLAILAVILLLASRRK